MLRLIVTSLLASLLLVACTNKSDDGCEDGVDCAEDCTDGVDNDGNGEIDCEDAACADECVEDCTDGADNDGDGAIDCADSDCDGECPENCTDERDNDGDGLIDCEDTDCDGECPETCADGRDNDGDGLIDCEDVDCEPECDEDCEDEVDNDGDGLVDCEDDECDGDCPEVCDDGRDNDGDGLTDCEDGDCATDEVCFEDCTDGIDNDKDGYTDCYDDECWSEDCHPEGFKAYVTAADEVKAYFYRSTVSYYGSACSSSTTMASAYESGQALAIEGKVRAKPGGAATWTTCDWRVDSAEFGFDMAEGNIANLIARPVNRVGFYVEPGCGIPASASSFLPTELVGLSSSGVWASFDVSMLYSYTTPPVMWYKGGISLTPVTSDSSTTSVGSSCTKYSYLYGVNVEWGPINTGDTHSFEL